MFLLLARLRNMSHHSLDVFQRQSSAKLSAHKRCALLLSEQGTRWLMR
jgi:hypothetical protein